MNKIRFVVAAVVLALVAGLGVPSAVAAPRWSTRASATSYNNGARYNDGYWLTTRAPTRRDARKHQIQVTWSGRRGIAVNVQWYIDCWDVGQYGRVRAVYRSSEASPWMSPGGTWRRTWRQNHDFCQIDVNVFNTDYRHDERVGRLTVRARDLK